MVATSNLGRLSVVHKPGALTPGIRRVPTRAVGTQTGSRLYRNVAHVHAGRQGNCVNHPNQRQWNIGRMFRQGIVS